MNELKHYRITNRCRGPYRIQGQFLQLPLHVWQNGEPVSTSVVDVAPGASVIISGELFGELTKNNPALEGLLSQRLIVITETNDELDVQPEELGSAGAAEKPEDLKESDEATTMGNEELSVEVKKTKTQRVAEIEVPKADAPKKSTRTRRTTKK